MSDILRRIEQIAEHEGIGITTLERIIGASKGVLSRAIKNGTDIQAKWLQNIVENYPLYSEEWLLTGRGNMDKEEKAIIASHISEDVKAIPLIPISAMAGAFSGEIQVLKQECEHYYVPSFKGADFLITVKGSSMVPTYDSGDLVACKVLSSKNLFFQWNKVYVIDTDQGALIKRIKPGEDKKHLTLISDNPDYPPFQLSIEEIYHVALVVGVIRME